MAMQTSHCSSGRGSVPNATFSGPKLTTTTWSKTETPMAAHSHRFVNGWRNALVVSERALKQLNRLRKNQDGEPGSSSLNTPHLGLAETVAVMSPLGVQNGHWPSKNQELRDNSA